MSDENRATTDLECTEADISIICLYWTELKGRERATLRARAPMNAGLQVYFSRK